MRIDQTSRYIKNLATIVVWGGGSSFFALIWIRDLNRADEIPVFTNSTGEFYQKKHLSSGCWETTVGVNATADINTARLKS